MELMLEWVSASAWRWDESAIGRERNGTEQRVDDVSAPQWKSERV
jgi:hypothetical protein